MTVRVKVLGKDYQIKESVKNMKKTFEMQKSFFKLNKAMSDDAEKNVEKQIEANLEGIDNMVNFILDVVPDKKITADRLTDELSFNELGDLVQDIIAKILHVEPEEKKADAPESE